MCEYSEGVVHRLSLGVPLVCVKTGCALVDSWGRALWLGGEEQAFYLKGHAHGGRGVVACWYGDVGALG